MHREVKTPVTLQLQDPAVPRRASMEQVLAYAWGVQAFTSTGAMTATGLSRSTAIEAIDDLVRLGFLAELPNARATPGYGKGRPSRRFELRAQAAVLVGTDAGERHLVTTVADLRGQPLTTRTETIDAAADGPERRRLLGLTLDRALADADKCRADVLAVCVGVPAPVDRAGRSPEHPEGFWPRMNPDLVDHLAAWAPLVRVENDASLAIVAERAKGAAVGAQDAVALLAGTRLGAGVVVDGRLLRGAHGGAGELLMVRHLQGVSSGHGIGHQLSLWAQEVAAGGTLAPTHPWSGREGTIGGAEVLALAREGDAVAVELIERAGLVTARVAEVLSCLYDPERIVVCGAVADDVELVLAAARGRLSDDIHLPAPALVASTLGADVVSVGAVTAAMETARERGLSLTTAVAADLDDEGALSQSRSS